MDAYDESPQQKRNFWIIVGTMTLVAATITLFAIRTYSFEQTARAEAVTKCSAGPVAEYQICLDREMDLYALNRCGRNK